MIEQYKYITNNTSSIDRGYFLNENDLKFVASSSINDGVGFGAFIEDTIEYSVFNTSTEEQITHSFLKKSSSFEERTRSYINLNNERITYSYNFYESDITVLRPNNSILLSPIDDLRNLGLNDGVYKLSYNFLRNYVSSNSLTKLKILDISPSRTELKIIPNSIKSSNDIVNEQFESFSNNKVITKFIIDKIKNQLDNSKNVNLYFETFSENEEIVNEIKFNYSLLTDIDVINFIEQAYDIIQLQYDNFLFENYDNASTFKELEDKFNLLCETVIIRELKSIRFRLTESFQRRFDEYVNYFVSIFNQNINFKEIEKKYNRTIGSSFKFVLNFGNNTLIPILSWKISSDVVSDTQHKPLLIKLSEPLQDSITVNSLFWISNVVSSTVIQKFNIFSINNIETFELRGPNFSTKQQNEGNSTKVSSLDDLTFNESNVTQKLVNILNKPFTTNNVNVDYTNFENFVHFSSATKRLENYSFKLKQIEFINNELDIINNQISSSSDIYLISDKEKLENELNEIINNFTPYESFLNQNEDVFINHKESALRYDKNNRDSFINNTPEFILRDENNIDYLNFLNMIGEHFDIIYVHINRFPSVEFFENKAERGIADSMVIHMLESLGWNPFSGNDDVNLSLNLLGQTKDGKQLDEITPFQRTKIIWRRILNNLSYIYKTKGTEESIRALLKCYGIPDKLFKIQEFGGMEYNTQITQDSLFIFDDLNYLLQFKNSDEYLETNWNEEIISLEFKFLVDSTINKNNKIFTLFVKDDKWSIGIKRESSNSVFGTVFLTILGDLGEYRTIQTERIPIFNNELFTVLLRKTLLKNEFNITKTNECLNVDINQIPTKYEIICAKGHLGDFQYYGKGEQILIGKFNENFKSTGILRIGNYFTSENSKFQGCIDFLRFWSRLISDIRFLNHANFNNAFDIDDPFSLVTDLKLRLDFSDPVDISLPENRFLENLAFDNSFDESVEAFNFRSVSQISQSIVIENDVCDPSETIIETQLSGSFPYQFKKRETRVVSKVPNFGSNKFRNNKIRFEEQEVFGQLNFDSRSTKKSRDRAPIDTNTLGIFFSPIDLINEDILRFFGNFELSDFIGEPSDLKERHYSNFEQFKKLFYESGGRENVNFQDYINYIKAFIDKGLFGHIKNLTPARANLLTGILIEPSILERPKIQVKPPIKKTLSNFKGIIPSNEIRNISGDIKPKLHDTIVVGKDVSISYPVNFYNFNYTDTLDEFSYGVFAENGLSVVNIFDSINKTWKLQKSKVEIIDKVIKRNGIDQSGKNLIFEKSAEIINIIPIPLNGDVDFTGNKPLNGYHFKHKKNKRNFFGRISTQTNETTISNERVLNASDPVEITIVDRGRVNVTQQGGGNILRTD